MRELLTVLLVSGMAFGQAADTAKPANTPPAAAGASQTNPVQGTGAPAVAAPAEPTDPNLAMIPAGTKIPLALAQAISTKNAREGDPVYASTTFPFVVNDRILVPAGTYIQGKISRVQHAGRATKRAELLLHFTSMIYPSGYTVMLPGSVENTPGADDKSVKDKEGTIQADKDTGKRVEDAAKGAAVGAPWGVLAGWQRGA